MHYYSAYPLKHVILTKGMRMQKPIITLLCAAGMIISTPAMAEKLRIRPNAPKQYTVKKGDTLWGISGKYLYHPWKWPSLWNVNRKKIANPHLIYPGQVLVLYYVNGRPVLGVKRGKSKKGGIPTIKLSPRMRELSAGYGIQTINVDFYRLFMKHPQFLSAEQATHLPRLVGGPDSRVMYTNGDRIYADGVREPGKYLVFRMGKDLIDPENGRNLGKLIEFSGEAYTVAGRDQVLADQSAYEVSLEERQDGKRAKSVTAHTAQAMLLDNAVSEIRKGDYLLKKNSDFDTAFNMMPHAPDRPVNARIVEIMDGVSESGTMQTLILNRGTADGLNKGAVLGIYKRGKLLKSEWRPRDGEDKKGRYVNTPNQEIGLAMIYRAGPHVSSAIILESITNVSKEDLLAEPGRDLETFGPSNVGKENMIRN